MSNEVKGRVFIGSSADDSIGIGYILQGSKYNKTSEGYELLCEFGGVSQWVNVYDIIEVESKLTDSTYINYIGE